MGVAAYVIPMAVLAAVVVVSLIAVWWWFPKAYRKGVRADESVVNQAQGADREAQRQANRDIIERFKRARAIERGEVVDTHDDIELAAPPPAYAAPPEYAAKSPRVEADHV